MKKLIFVFMVIFLVSCGGDYISKPKNLITENTMAEIMADLAINDQAVMQYQNSNMEAGTRYILKLHGVNSKDYSESFKYYVIKNKMNGITEDAQKIILEKDPKADKYIKDKKKNNNVGELQNAPALVR
ncbi:DUF4296 domain-containing protein [Chryseobacterium arachidis]|nr:DUF4296 domain-containing protein [Chryseobacterium arachidis]